MALIGQPLPKNRTQHVHYRYYLPYIQTPTAIHCAPRAAARFPISSFHFISSTSIPPLPFPLLLSLHLISSFFHLRRSSSSIGLFRRLDTRFFFLHFFLFLLFIRISPPLPSFLFIPVAFFSAWCCLILIFFIIFLSLFLLSQQGVDFYIKQSPSKTGCCPGSRLFARCSVYLIPLLFPLILAQRYDNAALPSVSILQYLFSIIFSLLFLYFYFLLFSFFFDYLIFLFWPRYSSTLVVPLG